MESHNRLQHIINSLIEYRKLWLLPAIGGLLLATVYAFFIKGDVWTARQSMIIRDDLLGENFKPGSFISEEAMKSAQETVLESARRPEVIREVLQELGPESSLFGFGGASNWPSDDTVDSVRGSVSFESANGGEYGQSEVVVLAAKDSNPARAQKFLTLLLDRIDEKLSEIRADRFQSMEAELRATRESALRTRETLEQRVMKMEADLGSDISLVRSMNEQGGGSPSAFESKLNEIHLQRREASRDLSEIESLKRSLAEARRDPNTLDELPTSAELLNSQPALANLVESLAKAKQNLSEAEGLYRPAHPRHQSATDQVVAIKSQIRKSLGTVVRGLDGQLATLQDRIALLDGLLAENEETLRRVSGLRVPYAMATQELDKQTEDFSDASARLMNMQSRKTASSSINLLTRIGEPVIGARPDGLGKKSLALVGGIAGLLIGLGLVMIIAPPFHDDPFAARQPQPDEASQRLQDHLPTHVRETPPASPAPETARSGDASSPPDAGQPAMAPIHDAVQSSFSAGGAAVAAGGGAAVAGAAAVMTSVQSTVTETAKISVPSVAQDPAVRQPVATPPVSEASSSANLAASPPEDPPVAPPSPAETAISEPVAEATEQAPVTKPASKTLAAIFANMPQPRTDIAVDASSATAAAETVSPEVAASTRTPAATIQLPADEIPDNPAAIPLQRRTTYRPVDLAKEEANKQSSDSKQESIDEVFSELKPKPGETGKRTSSPTEVYKADSN